jgi:hypothetical protein
MALRLGVLGTREELYISYNNGPVPLNNSDPFNHPRIHKYEAFRTLPRSYTNLGFFYFYPHSLSGHKAQSHQKIQMDG